MKRFITILMTLLLISTFSFSAFAQSEEVYTYEIGNVTVIFDETDTFDAATRENVAYKLVNGTNDEIATYNVLCSLLGHKYQSKTVTTITHCAQEEQPRCLEEHFDVIVCERCENTVVDLIGYGYITCCP